MNTIQSVRLPTLLDALQATMLTDAADVEIQGVYISDLLSDVLAHTGPGVLWVTIQTHRNVLSVAAMKDVSAVLITCGRKPDATIIAEADEEGVAILSTPLTTYEAAGKLWEARIR
jgi:predicted transcriptional regulator